MHIITVEFSRSRIPGNEFSGILDQARSRFPVNNASTPEKLEILS